MTAKVEPDGSWTLTCNYNGDMFPEEKGATQLTVPATQGWNTSCGIGKLAASFSCSLTPSE